MVVPGLPVFPAERRSLLNVKLNVKWPKWQNLLESDVRSWLGKNVAV